ncbi:MAG: TonB-dependent receptor plug domain-containing protein [Schleiferiaceae bacterium]
MRRIILFTVAALNVGHLAAQESPKGPPRDSLITLDETVVTVSRNATSLAATYVSVDVLPSRLALDKPNGRIEQTLQMAPGVTMQDGQANIRSGSGWSLGSGSRVLVLVDDLPALSPDAGGVQWSALPMEALDQVEVVKGASSSLYGSSALNGVIHLRTWEPSAKPRVLVSTLAESYGQPGGYRSMRWYDGPRGRGALRFAASGSDSTGRHGWVVHGQAFGDQGYQYGVGETSGRIHAKYRFRPNARTEWGLNAQYLNRSSRSALLWEDFRYGYTPLDSSATQTQSQIGALAGHLIVRGERIKHTLRLRGLGINTASFLDTNDYSNASQQVLGEYLAQAYRGAWSWTAGIQGSASQMSSPLFSGDHRSANLGALLQLDYTRARWDAHVGLRYEAFAIDDLDVFRRPILRAGAHRAFGRATHLRASWAQGFRYPSVAELYSASAAGVLQVFPRPGLKPEQGWTAEIALRQVVKGRGGLKGYLDVALFRTEFRDMLEFSFGQWANVPNAGLANFGFTSLNVGPTRIQGAEATAVGEAKLGPGTLQAMLSYTLAQPLALDPNLVYATDAAGAELSYTSTSLDPSRRVLKYRYRHVGKADLAYVWGRVTGAFSLRANSFMDNIDGIFTSPLVAIYVPGVADARRYTSGGDFVADARVQYKVSDRWTLIAAGTNLTNRVVSPRPALLAEPRMWSIQANFYLH